MYQQDAVVNVHFSATEKEILRRKYHIPRLNEPELTTRIVDAVRQEAAQSEGVELPRLNVVKKGTF